MGNKMEFRALNVLGITEKLKRIDSNYYVEGYATTFDEPYLMYEYDGVKYYEIVDRNALVGADITDVIMQYDHSGKVLARNTNDTLGLDCDDKGFLIFADLGKSRSAKDLYEEISNKLVTKMSWGFTVLEDSYDAVTHTRTILKIKKVYDVSAVSIPANGGTNIDARSFVESQVQFDKDNINLRKRKLELKLKLED